MVDIPMTSKKPMRTSELGGINRVGQSQSLQSLCAGQTAPRRSTPPPNRAQSTPPPNRAQSTPPPNRAQSTPPPNRAQSTPPPNRAQSAPPPRRPHPPAAGTMVQKGQKISLSQLDPTLEQIEVGMGWDLGPGGRGYDLDVEAFLLKADGTVPGDDWFVFYNQPGSPDGAVRLLEASVSGDDAVIQVRLSQVNPGVAKIAFIVTINEARTHGRHFGNVANAYVRIVNSSTRRELVRFQLTDYYNSVCSMVVGEIYRYKNEWRFNPVGNGTGDDLEGLCRRYGVNV